MTYAIEGTQGIEVISDNGERRVIYPACDLRREVRVNGVDLRDDGKIDRVRGEVYLNGRLVGRVELSGSQIGPRVSQESQSQNP
jgi:hypothetical protein